MVSKIDFLIMNAGVMHLPKEEISMNGKGWEMHLAVNYIGHFYLVDLLWDVLKISKFPVRIIGASSVVHHMANMDFSWGSKKTETDDSVATSHESQYKP